MDSTVDPEAAILELRRQKVESKFYHVRSKILPKQMKKVKVFLTQRVVKKIKQKKTEGFVEENDTKSLEVELNKTKALDHVKLATWAFNTQLFKNDDYLKEKLRELGIYLPFACEEVEDSGKLISVKCFQDAVKSCREDLNSFVKKLFHEAPVETKGKKPTLESDENKRARTNMSKPLSADKSFFMKSLNEDDSDEYEMSGSEGEESNDIYGRVAFSDDEDGSDFYSEEEEQPKPKKKKNRLGQVARRRLAEKLYGGEAKHIKSGGLTVQQREEQRKQKSQQKKERAARIKKDAGKISKARGSKELVESFKDKIGESVATPVTVKIDPKMHPSWAAKLQQQAKLQQASYQGQKIKFDE